MSTKKEQERPPVSCRIDREIYLWLKAKATLTGYNVSQIINAIITRFYNQNK